MSSLQSAPDAATSVARFLAERAKGGLSPKQRLVVRYFSEHPDDGPFASVHEVAARVGVNPATVVRLAHALGFPGYPALKMALRHAYLSGLSANQLVTGQGHGEGHDWAQAIIQRDINNLQVLQQTVDAAALRRLAERMLASRRIVVVSIGSYAAPALVLAHLCGSLGCPVYCETRGGPHVPAQLAALGEQDLLIGVTFWRGGRETVRALKAARERGIPTAVLTDSPFSAAAESADHVLTAPSEGFLFYQSMTAPIALVNCVAHAVWEMGGERTRQGLARMQSLYTEWGLPYDGGQLE